MNSELENATKSESKIEHLSVIDWWCKNTSQSTFTYSTFTALSTLEKTDTPIAVLIISNAFIEIATTTDQSNVESQCRNALAKLVSLAGDDDAIIKLYLSVCERLVHLSSMYNADIMGTLMNRVLYLVIEFATILLSRNKKEIYQLFITPEQLQNLADLYYSFEYDSQKKIH